MSGSFPEQPAATDVREHLLALSEGVAILLSERVQVAQALADFYRAELSLSSVQPILDLAVRLNPSLRRADQ